MIMIIIIIIIIIIMQPGYGLQTKHKMRTRFIS